MLWHHMGFENPPQLHHLQPPWKSKESPLDLAFSQGVFHQLTISPAGNWFASFDSKLRLWNWRECKPVDIIEIQAKPIAFSRDERWLLCLIGESHRGLQKFTAISVETGQAIFTIESETTTGEIMALDPTDKYLLTRCRESQFGILSLESGKVSKVLFSEQNPDAPDLMTAVNKVRSRLKDKWTEQIIGRDSPKIMTAKFSPDGNLLFCATTIGLRVYSWIELFAAVGQTPKALFAVTPIPEALELDLTHYDNFIYDVAFDNKQKRLVFCGLDGRIRYLDLNDSRSSILIDPPGKSPMWNLSLSSDRKYIGCSCSPAFEDRNKEPQRVQIWNYSALCRSAGIEW